MDPSERRGTAPELGSSCLGRRQLFRVLRGLVGTPDGTRPALLSCVPGPLPVDVLVALEQGVDICRGDRLQITENARQVHRLC